MAAIDAIEPGDGTSILGEAITVARAFAQSSSSDSEKRTSQESAKLLLFSDGRISDLNTIDVASGELVFQCIGRQPDNVAVTAMKARRSYEQLEQTEVFATLSNYGAQPVTTDVQLSVDGNVRAVRSVTIPAGTATPGQMAINFSLSQETAGTLEVRQLTPDALACDNAAWAILPPPRRLAVLLVTAGNTVLESAMKACPIAGVDPCTPAGFDAMDPAALEARSSYDVIVLDNCAPPRLPRGRYLVWGTPPTGIDVNSPAQLENQTIVDWRSGHPVLQYVNLANLFAGESRLLQLPRDAEVLAEFAESPALALVRRHGSTFLLVSFDCLQSNWPFEPSFVLFCFNAMNYLAAQGDADRTRDLAVGEPILLDHYTAGAAVTMTLPDGSRTESTRGPGRYRPISGNRAGRCVYRYGGRRAGAVLCGQPPGQRREQHRSPAGPGVLECDGGRTEAGRSAGECPAVAGVRVGRVAACLCRVAGVQSAGESLVCSEYGGSSRCSE